MTIEDPALSTPVEAPPPAVAITQFENDDQDLSNPIVGDVATGPTVPPLALLDTVTVVWAGAENHDNTAVKGTVVNFYEDSDDLDIEANIEGTLTVLHAVPAYRAGVSPYYVR